MGIPFSFPNDNLTRGLAAGWLFRVPLCRKCTIDFKTCMPSPRFEPRLYGTAFSSFISQSLEQNKKPNEIKC
ncbi:hypothetical protein TNCV_2406061 [Trichonephila clavipes]|nr:hypothetical protein TNCV_2406061 [Trichonephila clavipes]